MKKLLWLWLAIASAVGILPYAATETQKGPNVPTVTVSVGNEIIEMDIEEYATRVILAEADICTNDETKKALSVAARSVGAYFSLFGCKHSDFDVCNDGNCCIRLADIKKYSAEEIDAARAIVNSTFGETLNVGSYPALSLFTLCSGSSTRQSEIFSYHTPVKRSKKCEIHKTEKTYSVSELYSLFEAESGSEDCFIYADNGKCAFGVIGNKLFSGERIAEVLGLKSNELSVKLDGDSVTAVSYGVGHGYGLDLCGAQELAKNGKKYTEILQMYFPKLELNKIY